jgi:hypothetical protein
VTLGLSMEKVTAMLGHGKLRPHKDGVMYLFEQAGIVIYAEKDRVNSITVRTPAFHTRTGVAVGSDVDAVLKHLDKNYEMVGTDNEYVLHNWTRGWHAGVKDQKVTFFQITPALAATPPKKK